jgi:RNA ligase (TIGR02306 family)
MSEFSVPIVRIRAVEPIPDADKIELVVVGDYRCVTEKGRFQPGDLAIYLPEQAILPEKAITFLDMTGKLAGPEHNRIKAIKLRGCVSQGILLRPEEGMVIAYGQSHDLYANRFLEVGQNVADLLEITKWVPPVPSNMDGQIAAMFGKTIPYDIENIKAWPDVLQDGESVEFTEKLHGTLIGITRIIGLNENAMLGGDTLVYSKGYGQKGLVFIDTEENADNLYMRTAKALDMSARMATAFPMHQHVTVFAEIYGRGVQDLQYDEKAPTLRVFDVFLGKPEHGIFMSREMLQHACETMQIPRVPVLYRGPYDRSLMEKMTSGKTSLGTGEQIREGIVITPKTERNVPGLGRVILKSVSLDYLFRKGKNITEYN